MPDDRALQAELDRLRDLCAGDGRQIDVLEAGLALSAARSEDPLDLAPFRQHAAAMASDLADLVRRRGASPEGLAEIIARSYAYRGDTESYDDLQNADLVRVMERRKGLPVALSILYLHVARAQGWLTAREIETANALLTKLLAVFPKGKRMKRKGTALHEFTFVLAPARVVARGPAQGAKRKNR